MNRIRVMVVDDAVVVRRLITDAISADPEIEVVGTAPNGRIALQKLAALRPDVVTMDIEMPEMDGLETLTELRKTHPRLPVIMFSTLTERGGQATLEALARGATDYVTKPANVGGVTEGIARCRDELVPKIKVLAGRKPVHGLHAPVSPTAKAAPGGTAQPAPFRLGMSQHTASLQAMQPASPRALPAPEFGFDAVVIGVSTGGPVALSEIMPQFPKDLDVPILITQHMPPVFTRLLAERLSAAGGIPVHEGKAGERVLAGHAYIAPGGFHMVVRRSGTDLVLDLNTDPPENSCRPAVDVMFRSASKIYGYRLLSLVLTGMGQDGMKGAEVIRAAGGRVIAQDEASSVVWGMPGAVVHAGLADEVLPLDRIVPTVLRRLRPPRTGHQSVA